MRIEINAGGLGDGAAVAEYQWNMSGFISDAESVISSFKAVNSKAYDLNGGVGSLQGAVDAISERIQQEEERKEAAVTVQKKSNDFLGLAIRVDKQVATLVDQNRDEFYKTNPWLKPAVAVDDTPWYQDVWYWLCDMGEGIAEGAEAVWEWTKDTAKKAWDGLVEFYNEYWYDIVNWGVTILCVVGSVVAIAATGGAGILLIAGISAASGAIIAATRSVTTQQRDKGAVDWSEVAKEATTAAIVGAVTGAIGAGIGSAMTSSLSHSGIGAMFLKSSSATVRTLSGAAIGSTSEVISGMVTRGAAEATGSYLETGEVDFEDALNAAVDPRHMALDAAIGGVSGGYAAQKAEVPAQQKYSSVHDEHFPQESIQAVNDYVGPNHYKDINQSYINPSVELSAQNKDIDIQLAKILDQSELSESLTTHRGSSIKEMGDLGNIALKFKDDPVGLQNALEGKVYTKHGYMSTGEPGLAKTYMKDLYVTMDVPAGAKGLDVSISPVGKSEYLFPANCQQQISYVEWRGSNLYVHTKLVEVNPAAVSDAVSANDNTGFSSARTPYQSEKIVSAFSGADYMDQVSINSADLTAGKYGGKGTIRIDSLKGKIGDTAVDLSNMTEYTKITEFDVQEVKNYAIENYSGRANLTRNILEQARNRNSVLSQFGAKVNQTYFIDTVGHNISIGDADELYHGLIEKLPDSVDIFYMWK